MELSCIGNGYLVASFHSKEDYFFALEGGPWLIQNHYLTVQTWKSNFDPWSDQIRKLAIWVRLPGLPVDFYDRKFFFNLGNIIGKAIKVDDMTLHKARTLYARMCVEVDLGAPLLPEYIVDGNRLKIEYEGLHLICFHCGRFGHSMDLCPIKRSHENVAAKDNAAKTPMPAAEPTTGHQGGDGTEKYGEWMLARDPKRGKKGIPQGGKGGQGQRKGGKAESSRTGANRFDVLEREEEDMGEGQKAGQTKKPLRDITNQGKGQEDKESTQRVYKETPGLKGQTSKMTGGKKRGPPRPKGQR